MRSKLMDSVVVAAAVLAFSAAPGMVGLAAAKDRGATVRGGGPATQDAIGSTSTQTISKKGDAKDAKKDKKTKIDEISEIKGESIDYQGAGW
jgi:hypothetical protein